MTGGLAAVLRRRPMSARALAFVLGQGPPFKRMLAAVLRRWWVLKRLCTSSLRRRRVRRSLQAASCSFGARVRWRSHGSDNVVKLRIRRQAGVPRSG